jgi:hypothetical protein
MATKDDEFVRWLKRELGQTGYRKVRALQGQGMTLEQALELYHELERKKGTPRR